MEPKRRLVRVALELDEELVKGIDMFIVAMNDLYAPAKVSRSDFIRQAIRAYVTQEKKRYAAFAEIAILQRQKKQSGA